MINILDLLKQNLLSYQNMLESHGMKLGIQICLDEINKISSPDVVEVVRCKNCVHSIKKDYGGGILVREKDGEVISYEYLCVLKSTVTHLEEHEANYFCADGDKRKEN